MKENITICVYLNESNLTSMLAYKKNIFLKFGFIAFTAAVVALLFFQKNSNHLVINEISFTSNEGIDWIEIYNPSINSVTLKNFYITDKRRKFQRFQITENIIVPNQGFAVIYGKNAEETPNNSTITNFNIKNGETLYLVAPNGYEVVDSMTAGGPSELSENSSIGRFPDGSSDFFIMTQSTPGAANQKDLLPETKPQ